jgi:hypothetical protein
MPHQGHGTSLHLAGELFKRRADADFIAENLNSVIQSCQNDRY